jgi:hypothetical protein
LKPLKTKKINLHSLQLNRGRQLQWLFNVYLAPLAMKGLIMKSRNSTRRFFRAVLALPALTVWIASSADFRGWLEPNAQAATFIVTTNANSGAGSLRQAILDANGAPGTDTITFSAAMGISPTSALPAITSPVIHHSRAGHFQSASACRAAIRGCAPNKYLLCIH